MGCSDQGVGEAIALTSAEATLLYQEINAIFLRAHLDRTNPTLARTARAGTSGPGISLSELLVVHGSIPCKGGGTATISGDDNSTTQRPNFDISVTYQACIVEDFQLDGTYHQVTQTPQVTSATTIGTGDLNISVLADGRSGTCHLDFSYSVTPSGIATTGTICGVASTALQ